MKNSRQPYYDIQTINQLTNPTASSFYYVQNFLSESQIINIK